MSLVLAARGVSKTYPGGIKALENVDFEVIRGEVHALLGENGAGKSTLAKILYGLVYPDSGEIVYRGRTVAIDSPRVALRLGILYVPQYPSLPRGVKVSEVIAVYAESRGAGGIRDVVNAAEELGWSISLEQDAGSLPLVDRQRLMLSIGLGLDFDVLLLDEPTSFLAGPEVDKVLDTVLRLKHRGLSIVYITHRIDEVQRIADRVTVLRRGKVVARLGNPRDVSIEELVALIAGKRLEMRVAADLEGRRVKGNYALLVEDLSVYDESGRAVVDGVSIRVRRGEVVAITGIEGMGQRELLESIAGYRRRARGRVVVCGREVSSVKEFRNAGGRYVHGDRLEALAPGMLVAENVAAPRHVAPHVSRWYVILRKLLADTALRVIRGMGVAGDPWSPLASLSGGNQQKVLVGREVLIDPGCLLVAHNPTAGLDVASAHNVLSLLARLASRGVGVLFATPSIDEALAIADRILVMRSGRIVAEFERGVEREEVYRSILA